MKKDYIKVLFLKAHPKFAYHADQIGLVNAKKAVMLFKEKFAVPAPDGGNDNTLPEDFPVRDLLFEAGYDTVEKIKAAGDSLTDVKGVGKGTLKQLENWFEEHK
jgi:hypothetical protein